MDFTTEAYYYYNKIPEDTYSGDSHHDLDRHLEVGGEDKGIRNGDDFQHSFTYSANIGIVITTCNLFLNTMLAILVLLKQSTRVQFVYQQVISLALADLAFSMLVDPFTIYMNMQPWDLAEGFCVAWMVMDTALPFVSFLVLITLNADRVLFALNPIIYDRFLRRVLFRIMALCLPWMVGLGVLVPLWVFTGVVFPRPGVCMYGVTKPAADASTVVSLYLPCVALIILTVLVLITIIGGMPHDEVASQGSGPVPYPRATYLTVPRPTIHINPPSSTQRTAAQESSGPSSGVQGVFGMMGERHLPKKSHRCLVVSLCVLNLLTVITQLPFGAISMLEPECVEYPCQSTVNLLQALGWMRSVTYSLQPFCLISMTHIRRACCGLCSRAGRGPESQFQIGQAVTSGSNTKSFQVELTSVNTAVVQSTSDRPAMV